METTLVRSLHEAVHAAEALIPEQGPIGVFIHHNTLHHWEDMPFTEAVEAAARVKGAEPYLSHQRYLDEAAKGRITAEALAAQVDAQLDGFMADHGLAAGDRALCRAILLALLRVVKPRYTDAEVAWALRAAPQGPALRDAYARLPKAWGHGPSARQASRESYGRHVAAFTNAWAAKLAASYLDRGVSYWRNPWRDESFRAATLRFLTHAFPEAATSSTAFTKAALGGRAEDLVLELLKQQAPRPEDAHRLVMNELLALPGWAGQFKMRDAHPGHHHGEAHVSQGLLDYLAARLLIRAAAPFATEADANRDVETAVERPVGAAALRFELATVLADWRPSRDEGLASVARQGDLWRACLEGFGDHERRRVWHLAYEDCYYRQALAALRRAQDMSPAPAAAPSFGAVFCIDDREESFRRYLEAADPACRTYAFAGFFGVDLLYRADEDGPAIAQCPPVVTPKNLVYDRPEAPRHRVRFHRLARHVDKWILDASRKGPLTMPLLTLGGFAALAPLVLRTSSPRAYVKVMKGLDGWKKRLTAPRLVYRKEGSAANDLGHVVGFSHEEMADKVTAMIKTLRFHAEAPPLVAVIGHGAQSVNNPHASAYNCGACGGHRGALNARLFALMANDPDVRRILAARGLALPEGTLFVGGYHDTCSEEVVLFDTDLLPASHRDAYAHMAERFRWAQEANAAERTRRFEWAPKKDPKAALAHVEGRAWDFREPRAECGHATNALCVVGTRALTRRVFFDRRAFLVSYEPGHDPEGETLRALLTAVVPVCAGINLEYYFSCVDPANYGCGTKLPHNVTGLIGVVDGAGGDFRTGLPVQMTEIHEPVRLLFVIEADPARINAVLAQLPAAKRLFDNGWIRLASFRAGDGQPLIYQGQGRFAPMDLAGVEVPRISDSLSYCRGRLDHLTPAVIQ